MITFDQMETNMAAMGCECPIHERQPMSHTGVTAPIVDQLVDYCAQNEPVLLTPRELMKLAAIIRCQSVALDAVCEADAEPLNDLTVDEVEPSNRRALFVIGGVAFLASVTTNLVLHFL